MYFDRIKRSHLKFDINYTLKKINFAMNFNQEILDT